jgi:hypothetical protein
VELLSAVASDWLSRVQTRAAAGRVGSEFMLWFFETVSGAEGCFYHRKTISGISTHIVEQSKRV